MAAKTTYFWVVQCPEGFFQGVDREWCVPYGASRNVWFPTVARFETLQEANALACGYGKEHPYKIRKLRVSYTVE